jgi:predicted PurR-regulated permease PerM
MTTERGPFLSNPVVARAARWGLLAWSVIGVLILVYVLYRFVLFPIRVVFAPLVVALIVIYLLNPVVTTLQARGLGRIWAALLTYVVFLSAVGVALAYLIPVITHQVQGFVRGIPGLLMSAENGLTRAFTRLGLHVNARDFLEPLDPRSGKAFNYLGRITSFTSGAVRAAFVLVLGPLIAFYLLVDLPKIRRGAEALVPASRRDEVRDVAFRIGGTLGGFFRGQLLVALTVGLASMLGFWFVGLPFFALIGAVTGLFALVPLIGPVLAAVPALFVAATADATRRGVLHLRGGWKLSVGVVVVLVLVQQLDTRLLSPRFVKPAVRLHPVSVLLSLLVGGTLLGLWGMLLAVPVAAVIKVLVLHVWDTRSQWPPVPAEPAPETTAAVEPAPDTAATRVQPPDPAARAKASTASANPSPWARSRR